MRLENQGLVQEDIDAQLDRVVKDLLRGNLRRLWDDAP